MDFLWSPWRYDYVSSAEEQRGPCIFCVDAGRGDDIERLILFRSTHAFIIMNRYPYTSGHVMIAPYLHIGNLTATAGEALSEMMNLSQHCLAALDAVYRPDGYNVGMNLGECAGAGVRDHLHMHVVPRWVGDSSFMTVTGETRILPESLGDTYRKLKAALEQTTDESPD